MHVHRLERIWLTLGGVVLAFFFAILVTLAAADNLNPPSHGTTIDPTKVAQTPPFDKPGLRRVGDRLYEAYYVGRIFQWLPHELRIPAGSTVRFYVTSVDVVHGFTIPEEDVNAEVMPGWVSEVSHTFRKPGEYLLLCNQYCGAGHAEMYSRIVVTP